MADPSSTATTADTPTPTGRPVPDGRRRLLTDAAVVLGVLLLLGVVAGLVWPSLAGPVEFVRTAEGISSDEVQLGRQFSDEGWYVVLAAVGGAVAGLGLTLWRDRRGNADASGTDPVVTVLLLLAASFVAAWVMKELGTALGPPPVERVLQDAAVGTTAPGPVMVRTWAAYLAWPIAALGGAAVVLWTRPGSQPPE